MNLNRIGMCHDQNPVSNVDNLRCWEAHGERLDAKNVGDNKMTDMGKWLLRRIMLRQGFTEMEVAEVLTEKS